MRPQASEGEAQHGAFCGTDVSVKDTSVCIVDSTGKIIREVKVASEADALLAVLTNPAYHFKRIGLKAGSLSQWLFSALADASLPVICVETRHMRAVLKAQINKTDRNDARGSAALAVSAARKANFRLDRHGTSFGTRLLVTPRC
jgi:transposase